METVKKQSWIVPALGILAAIVTNTIANAGVFPGMGAVLLLPVLAIFWFVQRHSRKEMGFVLGRARYYGIGLLHPVLVLGLMGLIAWATGATNIENADWSNTALVFALQVLMTIPMTLLTEDGFFRGWLWSSLKRIGLNEPRLALITGIAFGLWHLPYAILDTGYELFSAELPLFIINASLIGVAWGLLRMMSGSVVVPSVVHGVWNAAAYGLFNNGTELGALGIQDTAIFGPEAGLLGLALNIAFTLGLWVLYRRQVTKAAAKPGLHPLPGTQRPEVV